jgi:hypothetical protein
MLEAKAQLRIVVRVAEMFEVPRCHSLVLCLAAQIADDDVLARCVL